jgi:xanthine dehydrogenase iron-sulfur cluster and FAD-binding subunit A
LRLQAVKRYDQDISTVISAFKLRRLGGKVKELGAAYGGMGPRQRAARVEAAVKDRPGHRHGSPYRPLLARGARR